MAKAVWNDKVIAESDAVEVVEGNVYFPPGSVNMKFLKKSDKKSTCPWKGVASYYSLEVDGEINEDAAWCYPEPKNAASHIRGYVSFWKGVTVKE